MSLKSTLNFILNHPLNKRQKLSALWRFGSWQLRSRLLPTQSAFTFGERSKLIIKKGLTGATGNYYCGLHEFEDMSFVLHFLRASDLFVDIGANIGSYTVLAGSECGVKTVSFEPIPTTFDILKANVDLNKVSDNVTLYNFGVGSEIGELKFTNALDTINHVANKTDTNTINVPVVTFDDRIALTTETLVKIDVEGFETEVIKGMHNTLTNPWLKAIIIELNGSGKWLGYDEQLIHDKLLRYGYLPYAYFPLTRELQELKTYGNLNTIYIKDFDFVSNRLKTAKSFKIRGTTV